MASDEERDHQVAHGRKPSRYITPKGVEAEFEPGSQGRVLRNRLHTHRKLEMDRREFEALVKAQEKYLSPITASPAEVPEEGAGRIWRR